MENAEERIRETWFQDHKATLTEVGELQILDWQRPGTGNYYCRYIFDGRNVFISGDIGAAVFNLTWKAGIHSFNGIHIDYFEEKLAAYSGDRRNYSADKAVAALKEWRDELIVDEVEFEQEDFEDMISAADNSSSKDEWAHSYVNGEYSELISDLDSDYWEWIYDIGDEIPPRIIGYLVGLQMASKQLKEKSVAVEWSDQTTRKRG